MGPTSITRIFFSSLFLNDSLSFINAMVDDDLIHPCTYLSNQCFNYEKNAIAGVIAIPLELKILFVLRVLGSGLFIKDGVQLTTERRGI